MTKFHINDAQREFIEAWIRDNRARPKFGAYNKAETAIRKIPVPCKPRPGDIGHVGQGYKKSEVKLLPGFDALVDLPAGWAVASMYDSGGNHAVVNAGASMLTNLWNCWSGPGDDERPLIGVLECGAVYPVNLVRELKANKVNYHG